MPDNENDSLRRKRASDRPTPAESFTRMIVDCSGILALIGAVVIVAVAFLL